MPVETWPGPSSCSHHHRDHRWKLLKLIPCQLSLSDRASALTAGLNTWSKLMRLRLLFIVGILGAYSKNKNESFPFHVFSVSFVCVESDSFSSHFISCFILNFCFFMWVLCILFLLCSFSCSCYCLDWVHLGLVIPPPDVCTSPGP